MLKDASPTTHSQDAQIWLSPKAPGSAKLDDYGPIALSQLHMKLLLAPSPSRRRTWSHKTAWSVTDSRRSSAAPTPPHPLLMAHRELLRGKSNYIFTFCDREAFNKALHGALHRILSHLFLPPAVNDLLLFLQWGPDCASPLHTG